jgi:hypothetical protein
VQRLTESKNLQYPASWHPSGKFLAFDESDPQTALDLMILPMEGDEASVWKPGKAAAFLNSPASEWEPTLSPDGRWLAYESTSQDGMKCTCGRFRDREVNGRSRREAVRRRSGLARGVNCFSQCPTSTSWSRRTPWMATRSARTRPHLWSDARFELRGRQFRSLDLHPDGERFALGTVPDAQTAAGQDKVVLIFNFFDELRRIGPVAKR